MNAYGLGPPAYAVDAHACAVTTHAWLVDMNAYAAGIDIWILETFAGKRSVRTAESPGSSNGR